MDSPDESTIRWKPIRSRTGCRKCRQTKVKCDEAQPQCGRCARLSHECDYRPIPRKKYTRKPRSSEHSVPEQSSPRNQVGTISSEGSINGPDTGSSIQALGLHQNQRTDVDHCDSLPGHGLHYGDLDSVTPDAASILDPLDHAALHYFRFVLPVTVDSKTPEYSGPAIVWILAQRDPMVMHSVCALAGRKLCEKSSLPPEETRARQCLAVEHCTAALRMLTLALEGDGPTSDLNSILATLWMMISYEQGFGDGSGIGFSTHLQGAAALYDGRIGNTTEVLDQSGSPGGSSSNIPSLTCQLMVWIAFVDGGAAINGLGGAFCSLLGESLHGPGRVTPTSRLDIFRALQRRSDMANFELWGASYPQDELVDDLQNSQLMSLQVEVGQLRYLLSHIADDAVSEGQQRCRLELSPRFESELDDAIHDVAARYSGLFRMASVLNVSAMAAPSQKRFAISVRYICSFFHAVVLCFERLVSGSRPLDERQRASLREIMALSSKAYSDDGDDAMPHFAWSLFVTALESDDMIHRTWILDRFGSLASRGENFRRAHNALRVAFREQGFSDRRIEYARLVRRDDIDRFVLT